MTTNPIMDVVMDCDLIILCEYEFIHHHCTSWILQFYEKKWRKNIELGKHVHIMHYALHHIQFFLVIHYIIYHLPFLFI
jgi:hypothetical protein